MRRRDFIAGLGLATLSPLASPAQQARPVIGFLRSATIDDAKQLVSAFALGLKEAGFVEGQNVTIEYRAADGQLDRLPAIATELIRRPVAVIAGDAGAMLAAKAVTKTVPLVFAVGGDPVEQGLVASLNRPGANVTGVHFFAGVLGAKRLELLRQVAPKASTIGVLIHPNTPNTEAERKDVLAAARTLGQPLDIGDVKSDRDIDAAYQRFVQRQAGAVLAGSGPFMTSHLKQLIALSARNRLPTCYHLREAVTAGGLMSYGASITEGYRQAGIYAGRILSGEKPGDLPVFRSSKFELAINRRTAADLGLEIPTALLATADELVE
jgi:putative ABC transport system substrate-binding protein